MFSLLVVEFGGPLVELHALAVVAARPARVTPRGVLGNGNPHPLSTPSAAPDAAIPANPRMRTRLLWCTFDAVRWGVRRA